MQILKALKADQAFLKIYFKHIQHLSAFLSSAKQNRGKNTRKISDKEYARLLQKINGLMLQLDLGRNFHHVFLCDELQSKYRFEFNREMAIRRIINEHIVPWFGRIPNVTKLNLEKSNKTTYSEILPSLLFVLTNIQKVSNIIKKWWDEGLVLNAYFELVPSTNQIYLDFLEEHGSSQASLLIKIPINRETKKRDFDQLESLYSHFRKRYFGTPGKKDYWRDYAIRKDFVMYKLFLSPKVEELVKKGRIKEARQLRKIILTKLKKYGQFSVTDYIFDILIKKYKKSEDRIKQIVKNLRSKKAAIQYWQITQFGYPEKTFSTFTLKKTS